MRTFNSVLASSTLFSGSSGAIATSALKIDFTLGYTIQTNFGTPGTSGLLQLLVSNVNEQAMFVVASSANVSSTGSYMFNALGAHYEWVSVNYIPNNSASTGIMTSIIQSKGF